MYLIKEQCVSGTADFKLQLNCSASIFKALCVYKKYQSPCISDKPDGAEFLTRIFIVCGLGNGRDKLKFYSILQCNKSFFNTCRLQMVGSSVLMSMIEVTFLCKMDPNKSFPLIDMYLDVVTFTIRVIFKLLLSPRTKYSYESRRVLSGFILKLPYTKIKNK